jgi:hypothetical protein|nr:MAG TPA: hypothetical protein [Caudoviricetes sp.]
MKDKKYLAEEYAEKEYARVNGKGGPIIEGKRCFTFDDIKAAFNAGRESVVEKASELEWKDIGVFGEKARYVNVCRAHKPLEEYLIQEWFYPKDVELHSNEFVKNGFKTIEEAKTYANEDYKKRIKQALGL